MFEPYELYDKKNLSMDAPEYKLSKLKKDIEF